jgi:Heterokaryon incompatibility protein (HET)
MLWADAICINQTDDQEKSLQVPLMAKMYGQAEEVLIWLGNEAEGSEDSIEYLKWIRQAFIYQGASIREPRDERNPPNDALWDTVTRNLNLEKTSLVLGRSWFTRRWAIQEMALVGKATVHCGAVSMDWNVLYHAVMALSRLRGDGSHFWNKEMGKPRQIGASNMQNIGKLNEIRNDIWANGKKSRNRFLIV